MLIVRVLGFATRHLFFFPIAIAFLLVVATAESSGADTSAKAREEALDPAVLANNRDMVFRRVLHDDGNEYFYLVYQNRGYRFGCATDLFEQRAMFDFVGFPTEFLPQAVISFDDFTAGVTVGEDEARAAVLCDREDVQLRYRVLQIDEERRSMLYLVQSGSPQKLYRLGCVGIADALGLSVLSAEIIRDVDINTFEFSDARVLPCYSGEVPPEPVVVLEATPKDISADIGTAIPAIKLRLTEGSQLEVVDNTCGEWIEVSDGEITGDVPADFAKITCRIRLRTTIENKSSKDVVVGIKLNTRSPPELSMSQLTEEYQGILPVVLGRSISPITFFARDPIDEAINVKINYVIEPEQCTWITAEHDDGKLRIKGTVPLNQEMQVSCRVDVSAESKFGVSENRVLVISPQCPKPIFNIRENETCGVQSYNSKEHKLCGPFLAKQGTGEVCGNNGYRSRRTAACGVELYNGGWGGICGTYMEDTIPPSYFPRFCRHSSFGVELYNACRHSTHGYEYKTCRHISFGVEEYKTCAREEFGVAKYKSCRLPRFGLESCE